MNFAEEIKARLTTQEVFAHYGFTPNRAGYVCCPFHNEKTPSLKIYPGSRGWYCFGCHKGGDLIDFLMEYFGMYFNAAVKKLNDDFALGLPIDEHVSLRQLRDMEHKRQEQAAEREKKQKEHDRLVAEYWEAFDVWKKYDTNKREYAPMAVGGDLSPLFTEAIKNIDQAAYELSEAETRLRNHEANR